MGSRWITGLLFCISFVAHALQTPPQAAIASAHPLATQAGMDILKQGGNAFDAAVTVAAVLAVVEPYHSSLGGGGFWLLHDASTSPARDIFVDARERAPRAATPDMYMQKGVLQTHLVAEGALAAAIPGEVAGMVYLAKNYGKLPLSKTLAPAIVLAEKGFQIDKQFAELLREYQYMLKQFLSSRQVFFPNDDVLAQGQTLRQPELAALLKTIAQKGREGFYEGPVALSLVEGVRQAGGIWQMEDLKDYQVKIRRPLRGRYKGMSITTAPLPSSGGIGVLTALNILNQFEMSDLSEADKKHLIVESLRRASCDRLLYMGDPDYVKVDVTDLTSYQHAAKWRKTIDMNKATASSQLQCGKYKEPGSNTTHYSILDKEGNAVAATLTVNLIFGSGFVVPKTGVLLNNEMDDFAIAEGASNNWELIGGKPNMIQPSKRPLSNMTPTFITTKQGFGILGTPGGSRIPSMMLLALLSAQTEEYPNTWTITPRYHHQYSPDKVYFEPKAFTPEIQHALRARGHQLEPLDYSIGDMQAIFWDKQDNKVFAASDPRGQGKAAIQ